MRGLVLVGVLTCILSACGSAPGPKVVTVSAPTKSVAAPGRVTVVVPQAHSFVTANLKAGAQKCLNRQVKGSVTVAGAFGPQVAEVTTGYSSIVLQRGGLTELLVDETILQGGAGLPGGNARYLVDATPTIGGTRLDFYDGWQNRRALSQTVENWARTGQILCS